MRKQRLIFQPNTPIWRRVMPNYHIDHFQEPSSEVKPQHCDKTHLPKSKMRQLRNAVLFLSYQIYGQLKLNQAWANFQNEQIQYQVTITETNRLGFSLLVCCKENLPTNSQAMNPWFFYDKIRWMKSLAFINKTHYQCLHFLILLWNMLIDTESQKMFIKYIKWP